jgi:hypothetical protein
LLRRFEADLCSFVLFVFLFRICLLQQQQPRTEVEGAMIGEWSIYSPSLSPLLLFIRSIDEAHGNAR